MALRKLILAAALLGPPAASVQAVAAQATLAQAPSGQTGAISSAPSTDLAAAQSRLSPGALELITLDGEFSQAVARGGGEAFVSWFADDAVTLNNGKVPVLGKTHIAEKAHWKPGEYKLAWLPMGAQMGPSGDMGFTWGHYDATSNGSDGRPVTLSGRYITLWKRLPDGKWKVALDASAQEPAGSAPVPAVTTPESVISPQAPASGTSGPGAIPPPSHP